MTREGFEPPTFGFGDQRSARLNYRAIVWCLWQDSNLHTPAYLAGALAEYKAASLPIKLQRHCLVEAVRFELTDRVNDRLISSQVQ